MHKSFGYYIAHAAVATAFSPNNTEDGGTQGVLSNGFAGNSNVA